MPIKYKVKYSDERRDWGVYTEKTERRIAGGFDTENEAERWAAEEQALHNQLMAIIRGWMHDLGGDTPKKLAQGYAKIEEITKWLGMRRRTAETMLDQLQLSGFLFFDPRCTGWILTRHGAEVAQRLLAEANTVKRRPKEYEVTVKFRTFNAPSEEEMEEALEEFHHTSLDFFDVKAMDNA